MTLFDFPETEKGETVFSWKSYLIVLLGRRKRKLNLCNWECRYLYFRAKKFSFSYRCKCFAIFLILWMIFYCSLLSKSVWVVCLFLALPSCKAHKIFSRPTVTAPEQATITISSTARRTTNSKKHKLDHFFILFLFSFAHHYSHSSVSFALYTSAIIKQA